MQANFISVSPLRELLCDAQSGLVFRELRWESTVLLLVRLAEADVPWLTSCHLGVTACEKKPAINVLNTLLFPHCGALCAFSALIIPVAFPSPEKRVIKLEHKHTLLCHVLVTLSCITSSGYYCRLLSVPLCL